MSRELIPPGSYVAKARSWALGYTKTGKEQLAVSVELVEIEAGLTRTWYGYFTDATQDKTLEVMEILGIELDALATGEGELDAEVSVVLGHEDDLDGVPRERIRWINRPGGGGVALKDRMDAGQAKSFADRLKGRVLARKAQAGQGALPGTAPTKPPTTKTTKAPKPKHPNEPGGASDDVPF
jgi:hypothetical protein